MNLRYASFFLAALALGRAFSQSGTLDPTYGNAGISILQPGDFHDVSHDVIVLGDNTSLICGVARAGGRNSIFIAHLLDDGSLDGSFGTSSGYTFFTIGEEAYGYALGIDSQGRIYATGIAYPTLAQAVVPLVRTDATGQPDPSFGTNGVLLLELSPTEAEARDLAIINGDRVMLAGSAVGADADRDAFIMRVLDDGTPDATFGTDGVIFSGHDGDDALNSMVMMDDGAAVGAGYGTLNFVTKTFLFKVDSEGFPENAFSPTGIVMPDIATNDHTAFGIAMEENRVFVTGWAGTMTGIDAYVAAVRNDGLFDPGFSGDGIAFINASEVDYGFDIVRYTNGDLIVCGSSGLGGFAAPRDFMVARLTSSGDPVMSFGMNGVTLTSIQQDFDDANAVAIELDGKLLLTGFTSGFSTATDNDVAVARYNVDWTLGTGSAVAYPTTVHPNPSSGDRIMLTHSAQAPAQVVLLDATGREARSYPNIQPDAPASFSVAGLAEGRYTLRLQSAGQVWHHALVIAR
ncbi:MAG: hypothetical protein IPF41_16495 [Flavobacteriales bacterium]|nr:hypothetical protein [Flavobacteriales bacterium]